VAAKRELPNLTILFRGDPMLINTYHGLCQPPGATTAQPPAAKFIAYAASEEGQSIIRAYGRDLYGDSLYNDANYASQYDH
jgi:tungstate transport system substrate-binding protein